MNGKIYLELSPTGQIFHETFKGRFESDRDAVLPPLVSINQKKQPELTDHGWGNARTPILNLLQMITLTLWILLTRVKKIVWTSLKMSTNQNLANRRVQLIVKMKTQAAMMRSKIIWISNISS